jgi:hypothetical protein
MNFLIIIILVFLFNNFNEGQLVLIQHNNDNDNDLNSTNSLQNSKQENLNLSLNIDYLKNKYINYSLSIQNNTNVNPLRNLQSNQITINTNPQINSKPSFCDSINDCFNCTMYSQLDINCKWSSYKCSKSEVLM